MKKVFSILLLILSLHSFSQTPPKCIAPKISMGANQSIVLPTSSTILTATATGQNGHPIIINYIWALDSGLSNAKIVNPLQNVTQITGLTIAGTYKFSMTCRDSCGAPNTAYCYVTVLPAVVPPPVVYRLLLVPNPAHHNFTATLSGNGSGKVTMYLYSPTTKLLQSASGNKSLNQAYSKLFYTYFYRPGNYTVSASINGTVISQTLILQ